MKKTISISLDHDDVMQILANYMADHLDRDVKLADVKLRVTEGRINEGYHSGPDQKARIDEVWVELK
jgi:hypothetical protein